MAKIRTINDLQEAIDHSFSWRFFELTFLKKTINKASEKEKAPILRAYVALLYAHWEGFIKESASIYKEYVLRKNKKYREVNKCFKYLAMKNDISEIYESKN